MPQKYKLTYFPVKALGEPIRYLMAYGKIDYEDVRITKDEWPKLKPTVNFGKMPLLEIEDGKVLHQHIAICRFLAKKINLLGKSDLDAVDIDIFLDTFNDLRIQLIAWATEKDEKVKEEKHEVLHKETIPFYYDKFDGLVKANGGYLVNKQLTLADLYFTALDELMEQIVPGITDKYENLQALRDKVYELPQIKQWRATRPEDNY